MSTPGTPPSRAPSFDDVFPPPLRCCSNRDRRGCRKTRAEGHRWIPSRPRRPRRRVRRVVHPDTPPCGRFPRSRRPVAPPRLSHTRTPIAGTAAPQAVKKKYLQLPGTHREPLSSPRYPRLRPGTTTTPNVTRPTATPRPPAATTTSTATSTAAAAAAAAAASSRRSRGWCGRPSSTCAS